MRRRAALGLAILLATISTGAQPAHADFRICNDASHRVDVAFGHIDYTGRGRGLIAEGWYQIDAGQCKDLIVGELWYRNYYYYAYGVDGGGTERRWDGETPFCLKWEPFELAQAQYGEKTEAQCAGAGLKWRKFKQVDVNGAKDYAVTLRSSVSGVGGPSADPPPLRPSGPPQLQPSPPSPPQTAPGGGGACQRFPNLC